MKILLLTLLFVSCNSFGTKQQKMTSMSYKNLQCKQKVLPIKVDYKEDQGQVLVKVTGEGEITDFKIQSFRGIDNLKVLSGDKLEQKDIGPGDEVEFEAVVEKPEGLSYLVIDLEGKVHGLMKKQVLTIPIGKLTAEQNAKRRQNIRREADDSEGLSSGSNSVSDPVKKDVHILRIE